MAASDSSPDLIMADYQSHGLVDIVTKPYDIHELDAARKWRE